MLDLRKRLHPTDCQLNVGIEILNAETDAIDTNLRESLCKFVGEVLGSSSMVCSQVGRISNLVWIILAISLKHSLGNRFGVPPPQ